MKTAWKSKFVFLRVGKSSQARGCPCGRRWQWYVALLVLMISSVLITGSAAAEERAEPIRIGVLTTSWGPTPTVAGLRDALVELGYRENEDFVIGVRFTKGDLAALPTAARQLVQYGVDLIFVAEEGPAKAVQMATTRIPIVFVTVGDPVGLGLVQSFARPGGNITGVSDLHTELGPKRLELFREIVPGMKRVLFPYDPADAHAVEQARVYRSAAHRLGVVLVEQVVRTAEEARATLAKLRKGNVDGVLAPRCCSLNIPGFILEATAQQAIPTMFRAAFWVERGGLASYGPDYYESGRQAGRLVDKILKGTNPAEIPVEVNPKIELAINIKVAKSLGLSVKPEMLYRADRLVR